jgi:hypothetical protein
MKLKITKAITWGGSLVDETVLDVLVDIQSIAPSATFRIIEASSSKAGGWPLVEIEVNSEEESAIDKFFWTQVS